MDYYGERGGSGVAHECVLERKKIRVLKCREELIAEGIVGVTAFIVLSTLLGVLTDERLLVKGGCPLQDGGHTTSVSQAD